LVLVSCSQKTTQPTQDFVPGDKSLVMTVGKLENTGSITDFSIGLRGFSSISKEDDRIDTVTQFSVKTDVPQNFFLTQNSYSSTGQLNYITPHTDIFEGTIPVDPKTKLATFSFKQIF